MEFLASFYDVLILLFLEQNVVAWLASWLIGSEKLRPTEWGLLGRGLPHSESCSVGKRSVSRALVLIS